MGVIGKIEFETANPKKEELIVVAGSKSHIAESFRTIRTNLSFAAPDTEKKTFIISSALPEEGKSLVSANLAVSFSQVEKKVLLVDCDLRKPRIYKIFDLERDGGLSEFLSGSSDLRIKDTSFENLKVVTSGVIPPNPAELLASKKMRNLLEKLREEFDMVIIDSAPILSAADSIEVAPLTNGVVMVIKAASTPIPSVQTAIDQISDVGGKVIGCILNNVDLEKEDYYYSYYRYYHHYYYYYDKGEKKKRKKRKLV